MKVLLVSPPFNTILTDRATDYPPLGLAYLAAALERAGHQVAILNAENRAHLLHQEQEPFYKNIVPREKHENYRRVLQDMAHPLWGMLRQEIATYSPDLVGITCLSSTYLSALNVSRLVKDINPGTKVVLGGIHATVASEATLAHDTVDVVVRGEGEGTLVDLVEALERGETLASIAGISYKEGSVLRAGPHRPFLDDLDALPFPAKHADLHWQSYSADGFGNIMASRGCPFSCVFCASHALWGRRMRARSPENVVQEMAYLKDRFGTRSFSFYDDTFNVNTQYVLRLCELIAGASLKVTWSCQVRAHPLDEGVLRAMRRAGCHQVSLGVEVGNNEMLRRIKKGETREQIERAARLLRNVGIKFDAFFMVGFPWETATDLRDVVGLMKRVNPHNMAILNVVTPYPGTELYEMLFPADGPPAPNWAEFYHTRSVAFHTQAMAPEEFDGLFRWAEREFNRQNKKNYLRRFLRSMLYPRHVLGWVRRYHNPVTLWRKVIAIVRY